MAKKRRNSEYPAWTPYGKSDFRKNLSDDVVFLSSKGKGIFRISNEIYNIACREQGLMPAARGKYDSDVYLWFDQAKRWGFVALAFPELFESYRQFFPGTDFMAAEQNILDYDPDYWEFWKNEKIVKGMSKTRDHEIFISLHKNEMMSVWAEELHPLLKFTIVVTASLGGNRKASEKRYFLIDAEKYNSRSREGYRCKLPYIVSENDREIDRSEIEALRANRDETKNSLEDMFYPVSLRIDGNMIELECESNGAENRKNVCLPRNDWIRRDLTEPVFFEMDGDSLRLAGKETGYGQNFLNAP